MNDKPKRDYSSPSAHLRTFRVSTRYSPALIRLTGDLFGVLGVALIGGSIYRTLVPFAIRTPSSDYDVLTALVMGIILVVFTALFFVIAHLVARRRAMSVGPSS